MINTKKVVFFFQIFSTSAEIRRMEEYEGTMRVVLMEEREEESEEQIINTDQTFKSDECVICLTNLPNVLFCNCGHLCLCEECDKVKSLENCPVCKIKNTIKRTIKY